MEDVCPYAQQNGALEVLGLDDLLPPLPMSEMASQPSQVSQLIPVVLVLRVCDGYTEAWSKSTFEAESIKELMRLTEEFESEN